MKYSELEDMNERMYLLVDLILFLIFLKFVDLFLLSDDKLELFLKFFFEEGFLVGNFKKNFIEMF